MRQALYLVLMVMLWGQGAWGQAPLRSLRPEARPLGITSYAPRQVMMPVYYKARIRPKPRPGRSPAPALPASVLPNPVLAAVEGPVVVAGNGPLRSARPKHRPRNMARIIRKARKAAKKYSRLAPEQLGPKQGSVCGDRAIRGQAIAPVRGRISANCTTAKALKRWVHNGAKPAIGRRGGGLKSIRVVAHYACRNRNNKRGGKLSEHAKGKAIDIAAFTLKNGETITVLKGWRAAGTGPILKRMHKAACGPFGTVLGPNANKYHQDHFHFDTAGYRSGPYCR